MCRKKSIAYDALLHSTIFRKSCCGLHFFYLSLSKEIAACAGFFFEQKRTKEQEKWETLFWDFSYNFKSVKSHSVEWWTKSALTSSGNNVLGVFTQTAPAVWLYSPPRFTHEKAL